MDVSEKEKKLIELLRKIKYGKVIIIMEDNQPSHVVEVNNNIKL